MIADIKIYQDLRYGRGWYWEIKRPAVSLSGPWTRTSGYALTRWGADIAVKKCLKKLKQTERNVVTYSVDLDTGEVLAESSSASQTVIDYSYKYKDNDPDILNLDAYCVNCKEKRVMVNGRVKTSDSGRRMAQGNCPVCNTKMNRILGRAS